jgi:hypothetical protein
MPHLHQNCRVALHLALLLLFLPGLAGCSALGAIAYKTVGPAAVPAEHALPTTRPTLLLVENYQRGTLQSPSDELAHLVTADLIAHKAGVLINQDELIRFRNDHPEEFAKMKIQEVGRRLGAVEVIYVNLQELSVSSLPASEMLQGRIAASVRVIDVETGKTVWPGIGGDREFKDDTEFVPKAAVDSITAMQSQMVQDLATPVAQLFYKYAAKDDSNTK